MTTYPNYDFSKSRHGLVVFDLDGCLSQNPYDDPTIRTFKPDYEYWHRHWHRVDNPCHPDIVQLLLDMLELNKYRVVILTARPSCAIEPTIEWIVKHVGKVPISYDQGGACLDKITIPSDSPCSIPYLATYPGQKSIPQSHAWKVQVLEEWKKQGVHIHWIVEDYKPNADSLRSVAPVLLHERVK